MALADYRNSDLFDAKEKLVLDYSESMTYDDRDVSDEMFSALQLHFDDDAIVQLTEIIAWENASSKFNRALRIPSQGLWRRCESL